MLKRVSAHYKIIFGGVLGLAQSYDLAGALLGMLDAGDEVIVFDPAYDSYEPAVTLAGGRTLHMPLQEPNFSVDWDRLEQSLTSRTRLIILNSPHNPTGAMISRQLNIRSPDGVHEPQRLVMVETHRTLTGRACPPR